MKTVTYISESISQANNLMANGWKFIGFKVLNDKDYRLEYIILFLGDAIPCPDHKKINCEKCFGTGFINNN